MGKILMAVSVMTALVLGGLTLAYALPVVSDPSLVGYWKLDDLAGGYTTDSSGSGYNGKIQADAAFRPTGGVYGGAYELDGYSDRIQVLRSQYPDSTGKLLPTTNQVTVSVWFNVTGSISSWCQHPVSKWDNYHIRISNNLTSLRFTVFSGHHAEKITTYSHPDGSPVLQLNTWYHAVGTYDGGTARLYLDGGLVASNYFGINLYAANNYDLMMGVVGWTTSSEGFRGFIDEVAVWNRALSADEIGNLYAQNVPAPAGLLLLGSGLAGLTAFGRVRRRRG